MKTSIITVCRNAGETLANTLDSVVRQRDAQIEHIVIDGASTDNTCEIVARNGRHVAAFVTEPDRGMYDAMNKGVAKATGEIIGFLNADDVYAHDRVVATITRAMAGGDFDVAFGDIAFFTRGDPGRIVRRYSSARFHPSRLGWGWMPAHPTLYVRRRVFEQAGPFRTNFRIAGDFEFVARIFRENRLKYIYIPEVLVHMQLGGISTMGWRSTVLLNREVLRACEDNGISTNYFKLGAKYPLKLLEFLCR